MIPVWAPKTTYDLDRYVSVDIVQNQVITICYKYVQYKIAFLSHNNVLIDDVNIWIFVIRNIVTQQYTSTCT